MSENTLERFLHAASDAVGENVLIASIHPCNFASQLPANVLFPPREGEEFDTEQLQHAMRDKRTALIGCTSFTDEEEASTRLILRQLSSLGNPCVFLALLLSEGQIQRDNMDDIMAQYEKMLTTEVEEVFMNPDLDADILRQTIDLACSAWQLRSTSGATQDGPPVSTSLQELRALSQQHHALLWEDIPRNLMPQLQAENRDLIESDTHIGEYQIVRPMSTVEGIVKEVLNTNGETLVIKAIDKLTIFTPGELEGIYREFRFLSSLLQHPNIVRCLEFFHSPSFAYMVFEHAGSQNLLQLLQSKPLQRLEADPAWSCFSQLASAVQYCHSKNVSHRSISLEHFVSSEDNEGGNHYKLIDFQTAMVAQAGTTSTTVCGRVPCIAPEMTTGSPYIPRYADLWSLGIVLLETVGGLESSTALIETEVLNDSELVAELQFFFQTEGSHLQAATSLGAEPSAEIVNILEALLKPAPETRELIIGSVVVPPTSAQSGYVTS